MYIHTYIYIYIYIYMSAFSFSIDFKMKIQVVYQCEICVMLSRGEMTITNLYKSKTIKFAKLELTQIDTLKHWANYTILSCGLVYFNIIPL